MKADEFWKVYAKEFKRFEFTGFKAVDPKSKFFEEGLFQSANGIWCVEETSAKGKKPFHWELHLSTKTGHEVSKQIIWCKHFHNSSIGSNYKNLFSVHSKSKKIIQCWHKPGS